MQLAQSDGNGDGDGDDSSSEARTDGSSSLFAHDEGWKTSDAFAALARRVELAITGSTRDEGFAADASVASSAALDAAVAREDEQMQDRAVPDEPSGFSTDLGSSMDASAAHRAEAQTETETEAETDAEVSALSAGPDFEDLEQKLRAALESLANFGAKSPSAQASSFADVSEETIQPTSSDRPVAPSSNSPVASTLEGVKSMLEEARSQLLDSVVDHESGESFVEGQSDGISAAKVLLAEVVAEETSAVASESSAVPSSGSLSLSRELKAGDDGEDDATPVKTSRPRAIVEDGRAGATFEEEPNVWYEVGKGAAPAAAADVSKDDDAEADTTGVISDISNVSPVASTLVDVKRMLEEAKSTLMAAEGRIDRSFDEAKSNAASSLASSSPKRRKEMQLHPTSFIGDESTIASRSPGRRSSGGSPRRRQQDSFTTRSSPGRVSASFVNVFDEDEGGADLSMSVLSGDDFSGVPSITRWDTAPLEIDSALSTSADPPSFSAAASSTAPTPSSEAAQTSHAKPLSFTIDVSSASEKEKAEKRARLARLSESRARSLRNRHGRTAVAMRMQRELEEDKERKELRNRERRKRPYGHRREPDWKAGTGSSMVVSISPPPTDQEIQEGVRRERPSKPNLALGLRRKGAKEQEKPSRTSGTHVHLHRTGSIEIDIVPRRSSGSASASGGNVSVEVDDDEAANALMRRLASGERVRLSRSEARARTRRMYDRLPEVRRKNEAEKKRKEEAQRRQKARAYAEKNRRRLHS